LLHIGSAEVAQLQRYNRKRRPRGAHIMKPSSPDKLPLAPLLRAYREQTPSLGDLGKLPILGPRFAAVLSASARFLYPEFIDTASESDFAHSLAGFYEVCVPLPLHADRLRQRAGIVRHAVSYLLRGSDPLPQKASNCIDPRGAYHVAGLGPSFWSALLQGLHPTRHSGFTAATLAGLARLGLAHQPPGVATAALYAAVQDAYAEVRKLAPDLSALHVDHFLWLVATMTGRNLWHTSPETHTDSGSLAPRALQQVRQRLPLRERLKLRGQALADAQELLESALKDEDGKRIGEALAIADPEAAARSPLAWAAHSEALTLWVGRLWESDDPYATLAALDQADDLPGAGWFLPAAVLHLRDPQLFAPFNATVRQGYERLDDSAAHAETAVERYRLFNEGVAWLRTKYNLHPLETADFLAGLSSPDRPETVPAVEARPVFSGFCRDTFAFLDDLARNNCRAWMAGQRDRYRFAVRQPLLELCRALADRYVDPVLKGVHSWDLDSAARSGRALTKVCKNAYGRAEPYNTTLWIVYCRHEHAVKTPLTSRRVYPGGLPAGINPAARRAAPRKGVQFFVRLDSNRLSYGFRVQHKASQALEHLREQLHQHGDLLYGTLRSSGIFDACRFGTADARTEPRAVTSLADLKTWATSRSLEAARTLSPDDPQLTSDDLVGDILLTFDRLVPLYACCVEADPLPLLLRRTGGVEPQDRFTESDFHAATHLSADWLRQARDLLGLKRQLILQGVPGTGKTHVARCLGRLLTGGRDDAVRLVQFHPAYSYEEFLEGIRVRSVAVDGRHDVTYPVEDGLLCAFAADAARRPSQPHVLIVDEVNRGNLPRIFGELLYLLEYRDQEVILPYSRRGFRLPSNLYLIATMNAADRSVALVDQALRRRFSFLDMPPDPSVLSSWLHTHPPTAGPAFAERVVLLFERLNAKLRGDLGPHAQVGHSYFMVPDLDDARLRVVWQHHVLPLLAEHFHGHSARLAGYNLDTLLSTDPRLPARRRKAEIPG
jgi:hypothetical protein